MQTNDASPWLGGPAPELPALHGEMDVDVLVVGGGLTGILLAYTLAEQGAAVGLIEGRSLAQGASGRNAGFVTLSPPKPYRELIALWGREGARAALTLGRRSHRRLADLVAALSIDCDYRATGSLRLARSEEEAADLRASLPDLHADGFRVLETPVGSELASEVSVRFAAAFVTPEDAALDPVRLATALAVEAARRGARLFSRSPLQSARWRGGLWEARTPTGLARARTLVLCANAEAPLICPALASVIAPRRGQALCTAPVARDVARRPTVAQWGYQYWRQLADRRLVIGGWRDRDLDGEVGYDLRPTAPIQTAIEAGLAELVPEGVAIERRWAGTMGFARDGRPLVGWLDPEHHLAIAAGFTGHGLAWAPACVLDLADLLSWRRAPGITLLDPSRFQELRAGRDRLTVLDVAPE